MVLVRRHPAVLGARRGAVALLTVVGVALALAGPAAAQADGDVTICHRASPGADPDTITVPAGVVADHLAHGDTSGPCPAATTTTTTTGPTTTTVPGSGLGVPVTTTVTSPTTTVPGSGLGVPVTTTVGGPTTTVPPATPTTEQVTTSTRTATTTRSSPARVAGTRAQRADAAGRGGQRSASAAPRTLAATGLSRRSHTLVGVAVALLAGGILLVDRARRMGG